MISSAGRLSRRRIVALLAAAGAAQLTRCAPARLAPTPLPGLVAGKIYVAVLGWHTEIGLRAEALTGEAAALTRDFPGSSYLSFGWGERDYYMAPDPGLADMLRALAPGPAVMLIRALPRSPAQMFGAASVYVLPVSRQGLDGLSAYLWGSLEKDEGSLRRISDGPFSDSAFYAATGTYSIANTCNSWTIRAVRAAGIPVEPEGVVFAGEVAQRVAAMAIDRGEPDT